MAGGAPFEVATGGTLSDGPTSSCTRQLLVRAISARSLSEKEKELEESDGLYAAITRCARLLADPSPLLEAGINIEISAARAAHEGLLVGTARPRRASLCLS